MKGIVWRRADCVGGFGHLTLASHRKTDVSRGLLLVLSARPEPNFYKSCLSSIFADSG